MPNPREEPDAYLDLSPGDMRALGYRVIDVLVEHFVSLRDQPVTRHASRSALEQRLSEPVPQEGSDPETVLDQVVSEVFGQIMFLDHPRFFAFVPSPSNFVSAMADALVAGFNPFVGSWLVGSGPAEIELVTIDWLRQLCGLPASAGGLFVSGGSAANLTALAVARHLKLRDRVDRAVVYCSDQTHSSIQRALQILGFGPSQLRTLESDKDYCLSLSELGRAVEVDRAEGLTPFCVVASAGTINTGAVDALSLLADFCLDEALWLHADGAYGAAAVLSERGRSSLVGLDRVDSLSLDPHKWLFQPFEIGCLLVRNRRWLPETLAVHPEYLRDVDQAEEEVNFRDYGIQLTRGFRALKLWMSLKIFGLDAFRKAVTQGLQLAEMAETFLRESACWEVATPAQLGIVTFRYLAPGRSDEEIDALNEEILARMTEDGYAMLSSTVLRGRPVLRLCTTNPRTTELDLRETIRRLEQFGEEQAATGIRRAAP